MSIESRPRLTVRSAAQPGKLTTRATGFLDDCTLTPEPRVVGAALGLPRRPVPLRHALLELAAPLQELLLEQAPPLQGSLLHHAHPLQGGLPALGR
jgi:hypothetical protein